MKNFKNKIDSTKPRTLKGKTYVVSLKNAFKDWLEQDRLVSLDNSFELPALVRSLGWRLITASGFHLGRSTKRLQHLKVFAYMLLRMRKHHGSLLVCKYLKASQLAIQKVVAETKFKSLREIEEDLPLRRLSRSGLPSVIPRWDRRAILAGRPSVIRWWLTVFSIYRVLAAPGKLKLSTITDCGLERSTLTSVEAEMNHVMAHFSSKWKLDKFSIRNFLWLETSGPSSKTSWSGALFNISPLKEVGLWPIIKRWALESVTDDLSPTPFHKLVKHVEGIELSHSKGLDLYETVPKKEGDTRDNSSLPYTRVKDKFAKFYEHKLDEPENPDFIGRLATKDEAAGKIRVFAIVDVWTQSALKPIHDHLFSILRSFPNDGTFSHNAAVKRCIDKVRESGCSYGYDLSAATDRLPLWLQTLMMSYILGHDRALEWEKLMVGRTYWHNENSSDSKKKPHWIPLRYAVGQPMGALSSWPAMALCHHMLVQIAYWRTGFSVKKREFFTNYELLGDDIIIFQKDVASQYLLLMEEIGVPINLSKSVCSDSVPITEFAKVTTLRGEDVSALSWKMFLSQNSLNGRVQVAMWMSLKSAFSRKVAMVRKVVRHSPSKEGDWFSSLTMLVLSLYKVKKIPLTRLYAYLLDSRFTYGGTRRALFKDRNVTKMEQLLQHMLRGDDKAYYRFAYLDPMEEKHVIQVQIAKAKRLVKSLGNLEVLGHKVAEKVLMVWGLHEVSWKLTPNASQVEQALQESLINSFTLDEGTLEERSVISDTLEEIESFEDAGEARGRGIDFWNDRIVKLESLLSLRELSARSIAKRSDKTVKKLVKSGGFKPLEWLDQKLYASFLKDKVSALQRASKVRQPIASDDEVIDWSAV